MKSSRYPGDRIEVHGYPGGGEVTISPGRVLEIVEEERDGVPVRYPLRSQLRQLYLYD